MDPDEVLLDKLESILDREQTELLQSRREHNTSWDRNILTLSIAAIGFCFAVLPISGSNLTWLFVLGVLLFVSSIAVTSYGYIQADKGLSMALESNQGRRPENDRVRHRFNQLKREMEGLSRDDEKQIETARQQCWDDIEKVYDERDLKKEIEQFEKSNAAVRSLNHFRTYLFLAGIIAVTAFASLNVEVL